MHFCVLPENNHSPCTEDMYLHPQKFCYTLHIFVLKKFVLVTHTRAVLPQSPLAPGDLLLPMGDQEILIIAPNLYAGCPGSQGVEIMDS